MAGCMQEPQFDIPDLFLVASIMSHKVVLGEAGYLDEALDLLRVGVKPDGSQRHQIGETGDVPTEHRASNVVLMVVSNQRSGQFHPLAINEIKDTLYIPRRIDDHALVCCSIAYQVNEVGHLRGYIIVDGEIAAGQ